MVEVNNKAGESSAALTTRFVGLTMERLATGVELRHQIETQLRTYGEPLRWAITAVDGTVVQVEAVVTVETVETVVEPAQP